MKSKRLIAIFLCFFLSCTAAYLIGQNIVLPLTHKDDISVQENDKEITGESIAFSFVDNFDNLYFEGKRDVSKEENPWGSTIAKIEDDSIGTSIMMVQDTGMSIDYHVKGNESISWLYNIHPWVSEASDGMSLYVRIYMKDSDMPILRRSYMVEPNDNYVSAELPLNEYKDKDIVISFSTDNGGNGDSAGDWLVLNKLNISSSETEILARENTDYWISAHYFADSWPANMWDGEFENIDKDLQRICDDGFNSIILVIPWRQFQPVIGKTNAYNKNAYDKLDMILSKADEYNLGVIFRVGYTWDYYQNRGHGDILERYENIVNDSQTMDAWLEYVERLYAVADKHESFWGGFICWEDFWNLTSKAKTVSGKKEESSLLAQNIGFSKYVIDNYEISDIRKMFDDNKIYSEEDIYIPEQDKYAFRIFYEFYDLFLNELLLYSQTAFPNLSMEVRVDDDFVVNENGENRYYSHENTYLCNGSDYTTIMYGIPIGFENRGERVTWEAALGKTEEALEKVKRGAQGKKIFIDQFLYYDNTQEFSHNAQLIREQIDDYLLGAPALLKQFTKGYGVWPYKDCYSDAIANGSFSDNLNGWIVEGDAEIKKVQGNNKCLLVNGAVIKQDTDGKVADNENQLTCKFDAQLIESEFIVKVSLNGEVREVLIDTDGEYFVEFDGNKWGDLTISVDGEGFIDNVKVYNFCQQGLLYDAHGREGELIDTMRSLNSKMKAE